MDRQGLLASFSTTLVPRAAQARAAALESIPIFSVQDDLLDAAEATTPNGQAGPSMRAASPIRSHDGRVTTGVWDCKAGVFEVNFGCDEVVHILEGEVRVTAHGAVQTLKPGDVAFFRKGLNTTWDVPRYVRKVWFHHNAKRTIRQRIAYRLRMLAKRLLGGS